MRSPLHIVSIAVLAAQLGACAGAGNLFSNRGAANTAPTSVATTSQAVVGAQGLGIYLDLMRRLVEGDTVTQAEAFRNAANAAELAPTTTNRLKLALALATPAHAASDASEAQRQLSALLVTGDALLPEERILASIHLKDVEQRLILDAAAEQLRREAEAELARQNTENSQRLDAALAENRRLRAELEDATEALDAVTAIERSIRERENGPEPQ